MYKSLKSALQQNEINFPKHWDQKLPVELFTSTDSEDLSSELRVTTPVLKSLVKEIFPNKPTNTSINKYLRGILSSIAGEDRDVPEATHKGLSF